MYHNACYINAIQHVWTVFTDSLLRRFVPCCTMVYPSICDTQVGHNTCVNDRLRLFFVARVTTPGRYGDGGRGGLGLYLRVHRMKSGRVSKSWGQRVRAGGKPANLGLGSYPVVTLKEAREEALENRRALHWGHDPRAAGVPTFEAAVEKVIVIHSPTWKRPFPHRWTVAADAEGLRPSAHRPKARERGRDGRRARDPTAHLVKQARGREGRAPADRRGDEVGRREGLPVGQPGG